MFRYPILCTFRQTLLSLAFLSTAATVAYASSPNSPSTDQPEIADAMALKTALLKERRSLIGFRDSRGNLFEGKLANDATTFSELTRIHGIAVTGVMIEEVGKLGRNFLLAVIFKQIAAGLAPQGMAAATAVDEATIRTILRFGFNSYQTAQGILGMFQGPWTARNEMLSAIEDPDQLKLGAADEFLSQSENLNTASTKGKALSIRTREILSNIDFAERLLAQRTTQALAEAEARQSKRQWWEAPFTRSHDEEAYVRLQLANSQAQLNLDELRLALVLKVLRQLN